jgi:hypothetical protein
METTIKLHKTDGSEVDEMIYSLADTIIETAYVATHLMSIQAKVELIMKHSGDIDGLDGINELVAFTIAMDTWNTGWYSDLDVCSDSIADYFVVWGD